MARWIGQGLRNRVFPFGASGPFGRPPQPVLVDESAEWIPAAPTVEVLGEQIQVQAMDAVRRFRGDLDAARAACEQAERDGRPVFWICG